MSKVKKITPVGTKIIISSPYSHCAAVAYGLCEANAWARRGPRGRPRGPPRMVRESAVLAMLTYAASASSSPEKTASSASQAGQCTGWWRERRHHSWGEDGLHRVNKFYFLIFLFFTLNDMTFAYEKESELYYLYNNTLSNWIWDDFYFSKSMEEK